MEQYYELVKTRYGWVGLSYTDRGLTALTFPKQDRARALFELKQRAKGTLRPGKAHGKKLREKLEVYFAGQPVSFDDHVDVERATPFQREVWKALQAIPYGELRSYKEVAKAIGRPRATRAVGRAVGSNPVPILIPCHRVICHDGSLGGFSSGIGWKKRLLSLEGALPRR